jgi:hypothetical protein
MSIRTRINKYEASKLIYRSVDTLKHYRQQGILIEGLHYQKVNSRSIEYFKEALYAWIHVFNYDSQRQLKARKLGLICELSGSTEVEAEAS